jgi:hypothetical protein
MKLLQKKNPALAAILLHHVDSLEDYQYREDIVCDCENIDLLYVYGMGTEVFYKKLQPWLRRNPKHRLVFVEDNLTLIKKHLSEEILEDKQVQVAFLEIDFEKLVYWAMGVKFDIVSLKNETHKYEMFQSRLMEGILIKNNVFQEFKGHSEHFFDNFYSNIWQISKSYEGKKLFGEFKGIPAIICGAGPSLQKNADLLLQLEGKALLIAAGGALGALSRCGVTPHCTVATDPMPAVYERFIAHSHYEVPLFYHARMNKDALKISHGPRFFLNGSPMYRVDEWINDKFGLEVDDLETGHSSITFSMHIAQALGCDPIIFVGTDLAFTDKKNYSPGVVDGVSLEAIHTTNKLWEGIVWDCDIYGNPIKTLWKWKAEAQWIGEYHGNLINSTEGGIGFPNVPNMALAEVEKTYLLHNYDIRNRLTPRCDIGELSMSSALNSLNNSILELKKIVEDILEEILAVEKLLSKGKNIHLPTASWALLELDMDKEHAYRYIFKISDEIINKMLHARDEWFNNEDVFQNKMAFVSNQACRYALLAQAINMHY